MNQKTCVALMHCPEISCLGGDFDGGVVGGDRSGD